VFFTVRERESDLSIGAVRILREEARAALRAGRRDVEAEIGRCPFFRTALVPLPAPENCPETVSDMYRAAAVCGVGPMAAVAGALAQQVGRALAPLSPNVVVENGGDVYLRSLVPRRVAILAGDSPLSGRLALRIPPGEWGVCTSSGRVGPSLSFGHAHAAVVVSPDAALADAAATAMGNRIGSEKDLAPAIRWVLSLPGIEGAAAILDEHMAAAGRFELAPV
jgi:ApbE superfamily uncharacterized protein (UPF0280 family)